MHKAKESFCIGFTALAFPFILAGCISAGTSPQSWPAPVLADGNACPDLSGIYENLGIEATGQSHGAIPLSLIFNPEVARNWTKEQAITRRKFSDASHVRVYGPNQHGLKTEVWNQSELFRVSKRSGELGGDFGCEGGALRVSLPVTGDVGGGVFFETFRSAMVMRASDGSLLVKTSSLGLGMGFYLIPLAAGVEGLARYRTMDMVNGVKQK
jgi:hypothetical protein